MKRAFYIFIFCAATLLQSNSVIADKSPVVASSVPVIASLLSALSQGTDIKQSLLMASSDTVHTRNMTPSMMRILVEANVIVVIGKGEPEFLSLSRLTQVTANAVILDLTHDIQFGLIDHCKGGSDEHHEDEHHEDEHHEDEHHEDEHHEDEHHEDEHHEDEHHEDEHREDEHHEDEHREDEHHEDEHCLDEHVWLGLDNLALMLEFFAAELAREFPASSAKIHANRNATLNELALLDKQIEKILSESSNAKVVVWHDAYAYFARHHQLPSYASVNQSDVHGANLSGKRFEWLISELEQDQTCLIFASQEERDEHLASLQREVPDFRHTVADPIGYSKDHQDPKLVAQVLLDIAAAFATCTD